MPERLLHAVLETCEAAPGSEPDVTFLESEWDDPHVDLLAFDRRVHGAEDAPTRGVQPITFHIRASSAEGRKRITEQVLTRYQRLFLRFNEASAEPEFKAILRCFCQIHDCRRALVRADFDHALDVWQWLLRIAPQASLALQAAALFHDIERLESEAERRIEQHAENYVAFKVAHAQRGSTRVLQLLSALGLPRLAVIRACELVAAHERPGDDPELLALNDADALSFFSLNSAGFLDYFAPEHTRKKVGYTLARMRPQARALLSSIKLPAQIAAWIAQA